MKEAGRLLRILLCFMCCCTLLAGCGSQSEEKKETEVKEKKIQIGFSFDSFVIERWNREKEVFVTEASDMGAVVNVQNANGDIETQIEQIQYFIKKNMDVIVIVATDSNGLSEVVDEAIKEGIHVIAYDRMINNADIDLYISFDNEKVGNLMAETLLRATDYSGNYLMLCGPKTDDNVDRVTRGFDKAITDRNISIAGLMNAESWRAEAAYEYLTGNPELMDNVDAIMCGNDNIATQTVRYLSENGMAGSIPVVGQDADLEACQRIVEGTQLMTVYKPIDNLAKTAAKAAVNMAYGKGLEDIEAECMRMTDEEGNSYQYISLEPVAVTVDNMDQVIVEGGFHLAKEVYLNVKK